jgi:cholesterol transport system auxiliary component
MSKPSHSIDRRALLASTASALVLSACSGMIGPPDAAPIYVLDPANPPRSGGRPVPWQLAIVLPEASDTLDSTRIALLQPTGQLDFFANASWQDRLPFVVQSALVEAFESSGRTPGVGRDSEGIKTDYLLLTDIREFEAHYAVADAAPMAQVRIEAKLVNTRTRMIVQSADAHSEVPASQNSVPSVVAALNQALADVQSQIVEWALNAPPPART